MRSCFTFTHSTNHWFQPQSDRALFKGGLGLGYLVGPALDSSPSNTTVSVGSDCILYVILTVKYYPSDTVLFF